MPSNIVYFIDPPLTADDFIKFGRELSKNGHKISYGDKDILCFIKTRELLFNKGPTTILSMQPLTEEVLPDNSQNNIVISTLKKMLDNCSQDLTNIQSLYIIDPYLFPKSYDSDYINNFIYIFGDFMKYCSKLFIVTKQKRNESLEQIIEGEIIKINSNLKITKIYTKIFHDRFWIINEEKGVFVGTSLNGIGKRYSLCDYLKSDDIKEIVQRVKNV